MKSPDSSNNLLRRWKTDSQSDTQAPCFSDSPFRELAFVFFLHEVMSLLSDNFYLFLSSCSKNLSNLNLSISIRFRFGFIERHLQHRKRVIEADWPSGLKDFVYFETTSSVVRGLEEKGGIWTMPPCSTCPLWTVFPQRVNFDFGWLSLQPRIL